MHNIFCRLFLSLALSLVLPLAAMAQVNITASTFPVWLLARQITLDVPGLNLELMIPAAAGCPHDYVLTTQDMNRLANTDILLVNGLGLDDFAAQNAVNLARDQDRQVQIINCTENLELLMLQYTPEYAADDYERDTMAVNPHGFASPFTYKLMLENAANGLAALDPDHASLYLANAERYARDLDRLGDGFLALDDALPPGIQVLTQHSALDYLARDAGLLVAGHIQEHEGQEPSASQMLALAALIRDKSVAAIFTEPQYPVNTARTLSEETSAPVLELDPLASGPADAPLDYYQTVMTENLSKLESLFGQ